MHDYNLLYQKKLKTTSIFAKKVIKSNYQCLILFLKAKFDCRACFEIKQTSLQLAYLTSLKSDAIINYDIRILRLLELQMKTELSVKVWLLEIQN